MSYAYSRIENGEVVCNKIYDDSQIEQAEKLLISLFSQNYNEEDVNFTIDDDVLIDFMVMYEEHKDNKELVKHWLSDALEFEVTISLTESVTEELINNLPDHDLESKPEEPKEQQQMENTEIKKVETAADEMKKWVIGSMPINMKKREETVVEKTAEQPVAPAGQACAVPTQAAPAPELSINVFSEEKTFDWASAGKTVGVFLGGAAVGAAGKWAWDHFFG